MEKDWQGCCYRTRNSCLLTSPRATPRRPTSMAPRRRSLRHPDGGRIRCTTCPPGYHDRRADLVEATPSKGARHVTRRKQGARRVKRLSGMSPFLPPDYRPLRAYRGIRGPISVRCASTDGASIARQMARTTMDFWLVDSSDLSRLLPTTGIDCHPHEFTQQQH